MQLKRIIIRFYSKNMDDEIMKGLRLRFTKEIHIVCIQVIERSITKSKTTKYNTH